jgi:aspartate racemase
MKTIGLIGGMSWESTVEYYRLINQLIDKKLGGWHSAKVLLYSVDFDEVEQAQHQGRWDDTAKILAGAAQSLERGGADFLVLCTNTMHKVAGEIEKATKLALLHLADVTGEAIRSQNLKTIGLLGTRFTMEQDFYRKHLEENFDLKVLIPDEPDRKLIHQVIYDELCKGEIIPSSREAYVEIISKLVGNGAQGIILGCTEIPMLVRSQDVEVPLFDTTTLHAQAAVELALS